MEGKENMGRNIRKAKVGTLTFKVHSQVAYVISACATYTDMSSQSSKNSAWTVVIYSSHFPNNSIILAY